MEGYFENPQYGYISIQAFSNATKSKTYNQNVAGAYAFGYYCDTNYCYDGYGDTTTIAFKSTGTLPNAVKASGSIPFICYRYWCAEYDCYSEAVAQDNISFTMNLEASRDEAYHSRGNQNTQGYGAKTHYRYDNTYVPPLPNGSSITSGVLAGPVTPCWASLGKSKEHTVEIIR
jgi:hypothetical protein